MSIVYAGRAEEIVYYVYKFPGTGYGISVTRRDGEFAMLSDVTNDFLYAVSLVQYLEQHKIHPAQLTCAAAEFDRSSCRMVRHG